MFISYRWGGGGRIGVPKQINQTLNGRGVYWDGEGVGGLVTEALKQSNRTVNVPWGLLNFPKKINQTGVYS